MNKIRQNSLILILLVSVISIGCKKQKFLDYDNTIKIRPPYQECQNCTVYVGKHDKGKKDIEIQDFESNYNDYVSLRENIFDKWYFTVRIKWEEHYPNVDPTKKIRFLLIDEGGSGSDYSSQGRKIVMQIVEKIKPKRKLEWGETYFYEDGKLPEYSNSSGNGASTSTSNPLLGKWNQVSACTNASGAKNYFNFSTSTSGTIGQIDCNNTCSDGGTFTQFTYSISGSSVSITPQSVSDFCGVSPTLASPFTVQFSVSGNTLTLDGTDFVK